jgi:hypothetical protein
MVQLAKTNISEVDVIRKAIYKYSSTEKRPGFIEVHDN